MEESKSYTIDQSNNAKELVANLLTDKDYPKNYRAFKSAYYKDSMQKYVEWVVFQEIAKLIYIC